MNDLSTIPTDELVSMLGGVGLPDNAMPPNAGPRPETKGFLSRAAEYAGTPKDVGEAALSIGSGMAGSVAGGLAGLASLPFKGAEGARDVSQNVSESLTYEPKSKPAKGIAQVLGLPGQALSFLGGKAGGAVQEAGGSPGAATAVDVGVQSLPMILGYGASRLKKPAMAPVEQMFDTSKPAPKMSPPVNSAVQSAKEQGFRFTPSESGGGFISKGLEGLAGEERLGKLISKKNQPLVNEKITQDLGLPKGTPLDLDTISALRAEAGKAYEAVRKTGVVAADPAYSQALNKLGSQYANAAKDFPELAKGDALKITQALDKPAFSASAAVDLIGQLRQSASEAFASRQTGIAKVYRGGASILEDMLDRHLVNTGQSPVLIDKFRDARVKIAKSYEAQSALNPATGNINPQSYARQLAKGKPLSGGAKEVGEAASAGKRSFRPAEQVGNTGMTIHDVAALLLGKIGDMGLSAATLGARPAVRALLASRPGQAMIGADVGTPAMNAALYGTPVSISTNEAERP